MARGVSGRLVIEVDPQLKHDLYVELAREGSTLKDWFTRQAEQYLRDARQPALFVAERADRPYSWAPDADGEE